MQARLENDLMYFRPLQEFKYIVSAQLSPKAQVRQKKSKKMKATNPSKQ